MLPHHAFNFYRQIIAQGFEERSPYVLLLVHRPPFVIPFQVRILAAIEEDDVSSTANRLVEGDATGIGGTFFAGGEIGLGYSPFRAHDLHSILATDFSITGGNFRYIAGDYYELPPEVERSVKTVAFGYWILLTS